MNKFVYNFIAWLLWGTFRFPVQVYAEKLRLYIKHRERLAIQRYVAYLLNDYIGDKSEVYRYFEDWLQSSMKYQRRSWLSVCFMSWSRMV